MKSPDITYVSYQFWGKNIPYTSHRPYYRIFRQRLGDFLHFVLDRSFSEEEMGALRRGNIPQAMEDKWFWYMEGATLWAHRSWTGYCIYRIVFREDGRHIVTVNRDPQQYGCTSIEEDMDTLNRLLDWWSGSPYDHFEEWLSETCDALNKTDKKRQQ